MLMDFSLQGKTAFVTGSSSGIGRAICMAYAAAGAHVILHALEPHADLSSAALEARDLSKGDVFTVTGDLSEPDKLDEIWGQVCRSGRSPDVIVHNVAIQIRQPWQLVDHAAFQKQMNANFWAGLRLFQLGATPMIAAKWGRLIAIGSVQEIIPHEEMVVYAATKAAFANVVLNLSRQLGVHGITVNSIAPGVIATDRNRKVLEDAAYAGRVLGSIAAGYFGQPQDCAGVALLLATDAGRYINGQTIRVDGMMRG